jgi:molybdenum cofactor guanylyltransferase
MSRRSIAGEVTLLGAVLAGGGSRRFGSPKALALFEGESFVARAARCIAPSCREIVALIGPADAPGRHEIEGALPPGLRPLPDQVSGAGPLGGLHAALLDAERVGADAVMLLACDMPLVTPAIVGRLGRAAGREGVVAPRTGPPPRLHPLCAVYGVGCLEVVEVRLSRDDGDRSMYGLIEALPTRPIDFAPEDIDGLDPAAVFSSANTPSELDHLLLLQENRS